MNLRSNYSNLTGWFLQNPKRTGFLVFLCLFWLSFFILNLTFRINQENQKREMLSMLTSVQKNIEQTLKNSHTTALTLALTVNEDGIPENFDSISKNLIENNPYLDAVQMLPKGIIQYIYPLKNNEKALGYNILSNDPYQNETKKAIKFKTMYFAGPLKLKQGGTGIVGRYPVYYKNELWGFSAVVIKMETFLESAGINDINNPNYYFQFSRIDPQTNQENFFLRGSHDLTEKDYQMIYFPDGNWKLFIIAKNNHAVIKELIPYFFLSLLSCVLIGVLVSIILIRPSELENLTKKQALNLIRSEAKYKTIFNQAAVGIAKIDFNSNEYIEINEQYCKLLGYSYEELYEMNFKSITHPDDLPETMDLLKKIVSGELKKGVLEKRFIAKDDRIVWARVTVSPLWIEGEVPKTVISVVEDITDKKDAEENIKKSEIKYKSLFNDSPIALWEEDFSAVKNYLSDLGLMGMNKTLVTKYLHDNPTVMDKCIALIKVLNVNDESLVLYNIKNKKRLIQNFQERINYIAFDALTAIIVSITQKEKKGKIETTINFPNGKSKDISLVWNVVKDYEKSLERVIVSTEDITQRKASQRLIQDSQTRIESLINTIDGIVWECDSATFEFKFISQKVEKILGYTPEEWLSSKTFWTDHIHPDDRNWAVSYCIAKTNDEKKDHDFEYRMIAKDGRIVWLRDIVNLVTEPNGTTTLRGIMIDITQRKDSEIELNDSLSLVTEQNKRLLNFSYIISHNLRSHTSNLQSLANLINDAEYEQEREELFPLLNSISDALNQTMHNLNEVVNIQTNANLNVENLNLRKYVEKAIANFRDEIKLRKIYIDCRVNKNTYVVFTPVYLENILANCISNAIRYSDPEKDSFIHIENYSENSKTILEIIDNGIGIDMQKNKDKIFGLYKTFHNNPDAKGFGLFITKNQIDAMGGKISVESKLNEGTSFKICFK